MGERPPPIEHLTVNVTETPAAAEFYRAVLAKLGLEPERDEQGREAYGPHGEFGVYSQRRQFFDRTHVAFRASSRSEVDAFYEAAVAAGGRRVDAPRVRPEFGAGTYSAYVDDPAGNGVEVIYRPSTAPVAE